MPKNKTQIDYNDFIRSKNIMYCDTISDSYECLKLLFETKSDIISYEKTYALFVFNTDVLVLNIDKNNQYYYEYPCKRDADIINNIRFFSTNTDIHMYILLDGKEYNLCDIQELIFVCARYSDIKFKFIFSHPPLPTDEIRIQYTCYLINTEDRTRLETSDIITSTHRYSNGICYCRL